MTTPTLHELRDRSRTQRTAREILFAFVVTFVLTRLFVLFMAEGWLPDIHINVGDTHVHHLALGILLLACVGATALLFRPAARGLRRTAVLYGVGLALTFDEFGMWLHLEDVYWQRASFDAVVVIAAAFGLIADGPSVKRLRPRQWKAAVGMGIAQALLLLLVLKPLWSAGMNFGSHLR
jgi:hypothetical protein